MSSNATDTGSSDVEDSLGDSLIILLASAGVAVIVIGLGLFGVWYMNRNRPKWASAAWTQSKRHIVYSTKSFRRMMLRESKVGGQKEFFDMEKTPDHQRRRGSAAAALFTTGKTASTRNMLIKAGSRRDLVQSQPQKMQPPPMLSALAEGDEDEDGSTRDMVTNRAPDLPANLAVPPSVRAVQFAPVRMPTSRVRQWGPAAQGGADMADSDSSSSDDEFAPTTGRSVRNLLGTRSAVSSTTMAAGLKLPTLQRASGRGGGESSAAFVPEQPRRQPGAQDMVPRRVSVARYNPNRGVADGDG